MNKLKLFTWRPTTTILLLSGFFILVIASLISYSIANFKPTTEVRIASGVHNLWLADTHAARVKGLSGVKSLKMDGGLLMKFDSDDKWGIWMKDMKISIDIIWLDKDKKVVHIVKNAEPGLSIDAVFYPKAVSRYVIELPAGSVDKSGVKPGSQATFDEYAQVGD